MPSRLKSLELTGYKTFASKTLFAFGDQITAIVGPNGSGKSNVADSIRWVLGEQSFSLLRGKKTEDMIFAGSELRPRAGMAQASVTFDNTDGWLPLEFAEISIARRAYRDGTNEYLLNGQRTRLRDIAELLGKVGLAERTYTIVGQGLIDNALSLKADERRALFEEAAGIGLYRAKREDSLRKLEQTQRNLERVHDILAEIGPRVRTLERQAQRARDYNQVKTELDGVLKTWYGYHWHASNAALAAARAVAEAHAATLSALQQEQQTLDHSLTGLRARLAAQRNQLTQWQRESARLRADAESLARNRAVADERLRSLAEQREALTAELAALETDLTAQTGQFNAAKAELERLEAERNAARAQLDSIETLRQQRDTDRKTLADREAEARHRVAALAAQIADRTLRRERLAADRERLAAATAEHTAALEQARPLMAEKQTAHAAREAEAADAHTRHNDSESRLNDLAARIRQTETDLAAAAAQLADAGAAEGKLAARADVLAQTRAGLAGDASGLAVLRRAAQENRLTLHAELADVLTVPPELDTAIAAALGQFLNAVLTDDHDPTLDLIAHAEARASLLPMDRLRPNPLDLSTLPPGDALVGLAADLVTCPPTYRPAVHALLGRTVIVRTRDAARQLAPLLPPGAAAITLTGETFFANGGILAGRDASNTTLALAREWRDLPIEIERARARRRSFETRRDQLDDSLRRLRADRDAAAEAHRALQTAERAAAAARDTARLELERARQAADLQQNQLDALSAQIAQTFADDAGLAAELDSLAAGLAAAEQTAHTLAAQTGQLTTADLADTRSVAEWQTAAAVAGRAAADAQTRLGEMQTALDRATVMVAARRARLHTLETDSQDIVAASAADRGKLEALNAQQTALAALIAPSEKQFSHHETELAAIETAEAELRAELHNAERHHADAQLDFARKKDELESLRRHISDDFGLVALDYAEDDMPSATPLPLEGVVEHLPHVETLPEGVQESLERYRRQLRRMGAINPDALNEFTEVKERHTFLTAQVADLEAAAAQLREIIAELDLLMEREFRKTFDAVAEQFKDTFARLFGGGTARLLLTEPDDPNNSGIDILARLPGRKQQGLALLSGGERALTASALIFALLRVNPPPFAMLDEVDAALDEANVGRFRDLLVEMSRQTQFVVITHNRYTVQAADTVYGISMGADSVSQAISLKLDGETVAKA
ncbi:MAG: chromosome segregation protein SMC [Chloroflexi bacterium]|nr:chromosome segregation protein SMC [Chloroflexota bacterium]